MIINEYYFCNRAILNAEGRHMFVHGTNCLGVMGSGVAVMVRNEFPIAYEDYLKLAASEEGLVLGQAQFSVQSDGFVVVNANTQQDCGGKRAMNYEAIFTCFEQVKQYAQDNDIKEITTVQIGAGLGGGDWNIIYPMLQHFFEADLDITLTVYNQPVYV